MEGIYLTKPNRISEKVLDQYVSTIEGKTEIQFTHNVPNKLLDLNNSRESMPAFESVVRLLMQYYCVTVCFLLKLLFIFLSTMQAAKETASLEAIESIAALILNIDEKNDQADNNVAEDIAGDYIMWDEFPFCKLKLMSSLQSYLTSCEAENFCMGDLQQVVLTPKGLP